MESQGRFFNLAINFSGMGLVSTLLVHIQEILG